MGVAPRMMCSTLQNTPRRRREECNQGHTETQSLNRRQPKDEWGDIMTSKANKTVRISFVNVNGIGTMEKSDKSEDIRRYMTNNKVDVMGLAETNVNWGKIQTRHTLWDRTKRWFEHRRIAVSYNTKDTLSKKYQPGGTATLVTNEVAHRVKESGFDVSGLGRWSWTVITGKQRCTTRIITVYCPTRSGTGMSTVYTQQLTHLKQNPTTAFWNDLAQAIVDWQAAGEQLVIMGDWNEDIVGSTITNWMQVFGLKEAITARHGNQPPPTYQRGSDAIDGVFVSPSIAACKAGYLGFGEIPGDHRGIWVDIPQSDILGYKMSDIPTAQARRLKLDDPRVVQRYQEKLEIFLKHHNFFRRLKRLRQSCSPGTPLSPKEGKEYDALDKLREKGMKRAARKCRKLRMGGRKWSPALQQARRTILFWTLIRRRLRKCRVGARRIIRLKKQLGIKRPTNIPLAEVETLLDRAYKKYKVCRSNDTELRLNYQETLANAKAAAGNTKACTMLKEMQQREKARTTYRHIRYATKIRQSGTTKIHIRTSDGFKEVTRQHEMEKAILQENETKFHQTEARCPLLQGKLYRDLGAMGDGPQVGKVLDGTYTPPPGTSEVTKSWLRRMKIKDPDKLKSIKTTLAQYREGWKKVNEQTASGELHMGHFKAGAMHKTLGWADFQMSMIPMVTGYSPSRWKTGTDVMLLKAPEVYFLDKLRTIVLYESDFNHENKRLGRDAMNLALQNKQIAQEQYSRPGRSAQDNALSKRLVFDYFRLRKQPFGMCACDLKSCYDRVVHTAASLALQRVGVPLPQIQCMFGTIQKLIHRIRTAFGLSKKSFGGSNKTFSRPPQGMGQGNGAGPTVWSILSSTIFEELHSRGFSTPFLFALSTGVFKLCGFSYVDDCDLIADGNTAKEVHTKLQNMLTLWDELMEVTGAAIAPDKCWWYLVDFVWSGGTWKYKDAGSKYSLTVRDKDGIYTNLDYLKFSKAMKMVGVHLAPNGNQSQQLEALQTKATSWANLIRKSPLDESSVWIAMNQTIIKGIEYPLAATTLTENQLESVMVPIRSTGLPRSGFTRKFPHSVLYGPVGLQGLGVCNPFYFQYCRHVQDIVDQTWRGTPTGKLLISNLEAVKLEAGLYGYLFDNPVEVTWFNTTHSWVIETYKFCKTHNIVFEEPGAMVSPQCENDRALMQMFENHGYSVEELCVLNRCRLYFQVTSVSDVVDGSGTQIPICWFRDFKLPTRKSNLQWPNQGKPTQANWVLWKAALRDCLIGSNLQICPKLGLWHSDALQYQEDWEWFLSKEQHLIQKITMTSWKQYPPSSVRQTRRRRFYIPDAQYHEQDLPQGLQRTIVTIQGDFMEASGSRSYTPQHNKEDQVKHWRQTLRLSPQSKWTCQWLHLPRDTETCSKLLTTSHCVGVSDGSYDEEKDICSAAWILHFREGLEAKGAGIVPSPEGESSAYRGELGGLLGQLLAIQSLEAQHQSIIQYTVQIACDGKSALFKSLLTDREYFSSRNRSFDIISHIIAVKEKLQAKIIPIHVYGHQDDLGRTLTLLEKLNVRMDTLAKEALTCALSDGSDILDALPIDSQGLVQVDYEDIPITSNLAASLRYHISKDRIMQWWKYKGRFKSPVDTLKIDWMVLHRTSNELSFQMSRFVSRWVSHHIGVGRMMELRQARDDNACPRCGHTEEDTLHVIRCRAKSSRKAWRRGVRKLDKWLLQKRTDPQIRRAITCSIRQFNSNHPDYNIYTYPTNYPHIKQCITSQARIGWQGFLEGLISTEWATAQSKHFKSCGLRRSGRRWAVELSKQVWKLVFRMWDHRNSVLFNTTAIDRMNGLDKVKQAIAKERSLGLGTLDPSFAPYLQLPTTAFDNMKSIGLRRWLSLIRQAREEKGYTYTDEFATSIPLRAWVGLAKYTPNTQNQQQQQGRRRTHIPLQFTRTGYHE